MLLGAPSNTPSLVLTLTGAFIELMADSICSKSAMDCLEEAFTKLASHVTQKIDDLLLHVAALKPMLSIHHLRHLPQPYLYQTHTHLAILK